MDFNSIVRAERLTRNVSSVFVTVPHAVWNFELSLKG